MRPDRDDILMNSAKLWELRSTCSRAQVGTVISRDGRILSTGYNGAPSGMDHCNHQCSCGWGLDDPKPWTDPEHLDSCQSQIPCTNVVHAEANAITFAAKYGVGIDGAEIHTTRVPCLNCAGMIINAGIKRVVWLVEHRDMEGFLRLGQAGLEVVRYGHE